MFAKIPKDQMLSIVGWAEVRNPMFEAPFVLGIIPFSPTYELSRKIVVRLFFCQVQNQFCSLAGTTVTKIKKIAALDNLLYDHINIEKKSKSVLLYTAKVETKHMTPSTYHQNQQ